MSYLNLYATTRHYGGPEEGGWWYNWHRCVFSIDVSQIDDSDIKDLKRILISCYPDEGNIYSVNGGVEFSILIEENRAESASTERPHYE